MFQQTGLPTLRTPTLLRRRGSSVSGQIASTHTGALAFLGRRAAPKLS